MAEAPKIRVLGFSTKYHRNPKTGEQVAHDYVEFAPAQALNAQTTVERVEFLRPKLTEHDAAEDENKALKRLYMEAIWSVIGPAYEAWKKGFEIPKEGTPLAAWAGVTSDQANALRKIAIYTVEDLASLNDDKFRIVPMPNVREVRDLARKYLETDGDTKTAARLSDLEKSNAALKEQLEAAVALLQEQAKEKAPKRQKQAEAA